MIAPVFAASELAQRFGLELRGEDRAVHGVGIQRSPFPGHQRPVQRRPHRAVDQPIAVAARARGKACVELHWHRHAPAHAHRRRQPPAGAQSPGARISLGGAVEVHDLALRMHAGIGAAGAGDGDGLVGHRGQGAFERCLHGRRPGRPEPLPALESAAVVLDAQRVTHRRTGPGQPISRSSSSASSRATGSWPAATSCSRLRAVSRSPRSR